MVGQYSSCDHTLRKDSNGGFLKGTTFAFGRGKDAFSETFAASFDATESLEMFETFGSAHGIDCRKSNWLP